MTDDPTPEAASASPDAVKPATKKPAPAKKSAPAKKTPAKAAAPKAAAAKTPATKSPAVKAPAAKASVTTSAEKAAEKVPVEKAPVAQSTPVEVASEPTPVIAVASTPAPAVVAEPAPEPEPEPEMSDAAKLFAALLVDPDEESEPEPEPEPDPALETAAVVPTSSEMESPTTLTVADVPAPATHAERAQRSARQEPQQPQEQQTPQPRQKPEPTTTKPTWRRAVGIGAGFLGVAAVLTAGVLWWYSSQGVTLPIFGGAQTSATAMAEPNPTPTPEVTETVPPVAVPTAPDGAVGLTEMARTADGSFFAITDVQRVDAQSNVDGSDLGPMLRISIAYANVSDRDADLMNPVVTVTTGADRQPAVQADAIDTQPFPSWVGVGMVRQVTYFFAVDPTQQTDMSVTVTYGADESATFWGDATMFFSGQAFAGAGATADNDASASSTEVEE
ncbi:hypothetical protein ACQUSY_08545 [Microbacterium sp. YY-03]|uniref:hypothetical protein n=1 Tax=Microbacterium sp. YY-03 TaxID=3421636 RepID=UPI003D16FDC1